ncbi:MAG: hypothetical protein PHC34_00065 [Candidatus Gastranaerophilales bacterium]|nr:hypothetical protein [Candidatus Gastranaerophilales bacterium]
MLNIKFNAPGCFIGILAIIFLMFLFKFWFVIVLAIIFFLLYGKLRKIINANAKNESKFENKPGKVYKECNYCGTKAERKAKTCSSCEKPFEQA